MARKELGERLEALAALLRERELLLRRAQQSIRLLLRVGLLDRTLMLIPKVLNPLLQLAHLLLGRLEHRPPLRPKLLNERLCHLLLFSRQTQELAIPKELDEPGVQRLAAVGWRRRWDMAATVHG